MGFCNRISVVQVLIIIDNHPRLSGLGLLQRLYQPYFGIVLFCGTWNFLRYRDNGKADRRLEWRTSLQTTFIVDATDESAFVPELPLWKHVCGA